MKIMIVGGNQTQAENLRRFLAGKEHEVTTFEQTNGAYLNTCIESFPYELMIFAWNGSEELLNEVRKVRKENNLCVIFLVKGLTDEQLRQAFSIGGPVEAINATLSEDDLQSAVSECICAYHQLSLK